MEFIDLKDMKLEEKHSHFFNTFGRIIYYDMCNGGFPTYERKGENKNYRLQSLTYEQIEDLIIKSEETEVDYLYQAVKEHYLPPFPKGCWS